MKHEIETREPHPAEYVREVTARYIGPRRKSLVIAHTGVAADFMRRLLKEHAREHFIALFLCGSHRMISYSIVSIGTANTAPAHPREVFQGALLVGACAIIVGHNHPSGDLQESREDLLVTERLRAAAAYIGINVLDHIIFTSDSYVSLKEKGHCDLKFIP